MTVNLTFHIIIGPFSHPVGGHIQLRSVVQVKEGYGKMQVNTPVRQKARGKDPEEGEAKNDMAMEEKPRVHSFLMVNGKSL